MKQFALIALIGSVFLPIFGARPVRTIDSEIPLIGSSQNGISTQLAHHTTSPLLDESTQQLLIAGSVALTGYVLHYDINHALNDKLKRQAFMKGCIAYITGKQIQHFYKDNAIAQEAGTLLAHYGRTIVALLLIYG